MKKILLLLILAGFAVWFYNYSDFNSKSITTIEDISYEDNIIDEYIDPNLAYEEKLYRPKTSKYEEKLQEPKTSTTVHHQAKYRCDGRKYCSQMNSCEEAKFFLYNCPNTRIDRGKSLHDPDGVPCEKEWCH